MPRKIDPIHPGEILAEEFLKPMEISQYRLAREISVPPRRINEIVHGKRSISPTRPCASPVTSAFPSDSGSTSKPGMTSKQRKTAWATA